MKRPTVLTAAIAITLVSAVCIRSHVSRVCCAARRPAHCCELPLCANDDSVKRDLSHSHDNVNGDPVRWVVILVQAEKNHTALSPVVMQSVVTVKGTMPCFLRCLRRDDSDCTAGARGGTEDCRSRWVERLIFALLIGLAGTVPLLYRKIKKYLNWLRIWWFKRELARLRRFGMYR